MNGSAANELRVLNQILPNCGNREENLRLNAAFLTAGVKPSTINWFIPSFENALYGGVYTLLRFASRLAPEHNIDSQIVIYDGQPGTISSIQQSVGELFPVL